MRRPRDFERLSTSPKEISRGPYPPAGFLPVWDAELGNGDYFGLYWPLGRENDEPIVCDMCHDESRLWPAFSSVGRFLAWLDANDGERGDVEIDDGAFAPAQFNLAKACITQGKIEPAIAYLRRTCETVPDVCDYWFTLAGQLRRIGEHNAAIDAALNAYRSGWYFGRASEAVLRMIRGARDNPVFADDPIVRRSVDLTPSFGGERENRNYLLLKGCVDDYMSQGFALEGLQVYQNYAFMMVTETTSFQERYVFELKTWQDEFSRLCEKHLPVSRAAVDDL